MPPEDTSTPPPRTRRGTCRRGFTLIEMLVVVSIIVFLMAITFPVIGTLQNGGRVETGLSTVSLAGSVARAWSTASLPQVDLDSDPVSPVPDASYSGTAAIFCPTNEVRIVINWQRARNGSVFLETDPPGATPSLNGYADYRFANGGRRDIDYIAIPSGTGVAGIHRFGPSPADIEFLAPPFAIAFDETGTLMQGHRDNPPGRIRSNPANFMYYDADRDGAYNTADVRTTSYNPADWNRDSDNARGSSDAFLDAHLVRRIPFEAIETVAGVIVYDEAEYRAAGFSFTGGGFVTDVDTDTLPDDAYDWLRENGTVVFFSPNTGVALRDEGSE